MSKLYKKYLELKKEDKNTLYLFKSGIFYIFLEEDAEFISELWGLKLTNLNETVVKCGFPISKISKYSAKLVEDGFKFQLINDLCSNTTFTVEEAEISNIIHSIQNIDFNKLSPIQAFNTLWEYKKILEKNNT